MTRKVRRAQGLLKTVSQRQCELLFTRYACVLHECAHRSVRARADIAPITFLNDMTARFLFLFY